MERSVKDHLRCSRPSLPKGLFTWLQANLSTKFHLPYLQHQAEKQMGQ